MSESNVPINTFRFMMPAEYDFGGQIRDEAGTHQNMGFDKMAISHDPETDTPLIDLRKYYDVNRPFPDFLWNILQQNNNVRSWLQHLFATDFKTFNKHKPDVYWRNLAYFDKAEADFILQHPEIFSTKFTANRQGPHIATEKRGNLVVVRIKEDTYENLYNRTRERIEKAIKLVQGS